MNNTTSTTTLSPAKTRQYSHLHAQLAQLNANLADTQNLMRMTSAQAGDMRFLGGYVGSLFMGGAKVLGEEGVVPTPSPASGVGAGRDCWNKETNKREEGGRNKDEDEDEDGEEKVDENGGR